MRAIWQRHDLENFRNRLKAPEGKVARRRYCAYRCSTLTKKTHDSEASGEIETAHPGYLGSQDTFCAGDLNGVGRTYPQTFVDTYPKVAHCKPYTSKTPITATDLLNDRVLRFCEAQGLSVLRRLTDRGTEYRGKAEQHDYQLCLTINDIDHTKTKAMSLQTNGICERVHKSILQEFY
ncbi:Integrase catalytic subunit [Erwinia tracheiphila PSU-1]|nr:Integrase catalytic subunit [Erwinia tracheiphila PSU-1]